MSSRRGSVEPCSSQETVVPPRRRSCEDEPEDRGEPDPFYLPRATTPTESPSSPPRLPRRQRTTQAPAANKDSKTHTMPSGSSVHRDSSSKHHSSSSKPRTERTDDWTDVTEPGERRRIQNRNAQRKYREKAREQREASERDSRNREHAGSSYQVPGPDDLLDDEEVSGLPWGGISMRHVYARGHESQSRRGSGRDDYPRDDYPRDDSQFYSSPTDPQGSTYYGDSQQSYGDNGGDLAGDAAYYYMDYDTAGGDYSHA